MYVNFKKKVFKMKSDATMCLIIYISLQPNILWNNTLGSEERSHSQTLENENL